ncbi:uncharacterized protein ARMOST_18030 [Armillaria ostoyae]|uniref:Uncharacterized protein n=1 Tax=Armillaria ostoyae TaxID=47428 RepID=A0A284S0Q2_ARMOS|nr:uncharacterized protein ARMOST_18030 [Armillaria ostoyae]
MFSEERGIDYRNETLMPHACLYLFNKQLKVYVFVSVTYIKIFEGCAELRRVSKDWPALYGSVTPPCSRDISATALVSLSPRLGSCKTRPQAVLL